MHPEILMYGELSWCISVAAIRILIWCVLLVLIRTQSQSVHFCKERYAYKSGADRRPGYAPKSDASNSSAALRATTPLG